MAFFIQWPYLTSVWYTLDQDKVLYKLVLVKCFLTRTEGLWFSTQRRGTRSKNTFLCWFQKEGLRLSGFPCFSVITHILLTARGTHTCPGALQPSLELIPSRESVQAWLITLQSHYLPTLPLPNAEGMAFPLDSSHVFHTFDVILVPIVFAHQLVQNCSQKSRAETKNLPNDSSEIASVTLKYSLAVKISTGLNRDFLVLFICMFVFSGRVGCSRTS